MSNEELETHYRTTFIPRAHRIGRLTLGIAIIASLLPGLYLGFVVGAWPGIGVIFSGFLAVLAFVGIIWIVEPISYFPVLGVSGSYMSFLSGNIGNMRMPVTISCQQAVEAEPGSRKAEVAAVLGVAVSVWVNLVFLLALIIIGGTLIDMLPEPVRIAIKDYTLPALYGAVLVMFMKSGTVGTASLGLVAGLAVFLSPIPGVYGTALAGIIAIVGCLILYRKPKAVADEANEPPA